MTTITQGDVFLPRYEPDYWTLGEQSAEAQAQKLGYRYAAKNSTSRVLDMKVGNFLRDAYGKLVHYDTLTPTTITSQETTMTKTKPTFTSQVYFAPNDGTYDAGQGARDTAIKLGYEWYTWGGYVDALPVKGGGGVVHVDQLESPLTMFVSYISDPARSMRADVLRRVTSAGFFDTGKAAHEQVQILRDIYSSGCYCDAGVQRFYAFMGDAMFQPRTGPKPGFKRVLIEAEIKDNMATSDSTKHIILDNINRLVTAQGQYPGRFEALSITDKED